MTATFTPADVLRLAPDPASAKSGQDLAHARKWVGYACDEGALWGECQGSGSNPYQTQVDLGETAFKCSCPSRKFPCKHGLGLLLLYAAVPRGDRPAWVSEWLAGRQARAEKKAAAPKEEKPVDAGAQAERRDKRLNRIRDGMAELHLWITDWVKVGIASAPSKRWEYFDAQARRLIDAQSPGAARRVQELGSVAARGAGWQRPFLERLALLHLMCRATERFDRLPDADRADLLAALGVPVPQDDLATLPAVRDVWRVASRTVEVEDKLRVQRTWLFGTTTHRPALVLHFAHGTAPLDTSLHPGTAFDGEVVFYPGTGPRAVVRTSPVAANPSAEPFGYEMFAAGLDAHSRAVAANPWVDRTFFPVRDVVPFRIAGGWAVVDRPGDSLPVAATDRAGWTLLAVSGGGPVGLAAEFDGNVLVPLAVTTNRTTLPLTDADREAA
jgi:hypothetical protein